MDYIEALEKLREKTDKQDVMIHTFRNPYGFRLNINHPMITKKWEAFKKKNNIGKYDMTDELREKFENQFMESKDFKACTKWFLILAGAIIILMEIYVTKAI